MAPEGRDFCFICTESLVDSSQAHGINKHLLLTSNSVHVDSPLASYRLVLSFAGDKVYCGALSAALD